MRLSLLLLISTLLLMVVGCRGLPFFSSASTDSNSPAEATQPIDGAFSRARLEIQDVSYDGEDLRGRLLISPVGNNLRIDKRLIESFDLTVKSVVKCDTGEALPYVIMDVLAPALREEDILILKPGFWYGKDIRIFLFAEHATKQPGPQCFEAEIAYHALDVRNAARVHVRAERAAPPPRDAGVPGEAPSAGTPPLQNE
jgi:hypothetical protein